MDIRKMLDDAQAARDAKKQDEEKAKAGALRIGNSGVVTADGRVLGTCHRISMARLLGAEEPKARNTKLMFQAGELMEEGFAQLLVESGACQVLRSDAISIDAKVMGSTRKLLGRPDVVLADAEGKPVLGLEHKTAFSLNTAQTVGLEGKPKPDNLSQTAAYSHYLGIPFVLAYTSPSYFPLYFSDKKKYGMSSIAPFYRLFFTEWRDGTLFYRADNQTDWTQTLITAQGIEDYFALVAEMADKKELGSRVDSSYADGAVHKYGENSSCKFCAFNQRCQDIEDKRISFNDWIKPLT